MKKFIRNLLVVIGLTVIVLLLLSSLTGCTQADRVSYNISKEADMFNVDSTCNSYYEGLML